MVAVNPVERFRVRAVTPVAVAVAPISPLHVLAQRVHESLFGPSHEPPMGASRKPSVV